jgi:flagellar basal-body rod modification protein FlgD
MSISAVTTTPTLSYSEQLRDTGTMDQADFISLLVTQLQNQDPLDPMNSQDMAAQMAQFSSLEELQKVNTNLESMLTGQSLADASSMIGKMVYGINSDSGTHLTGTVAGVEVKSGVVQLVLGDVSV